MNADDETLRIACRERFAALVESVGVKRFSGAMGLSTRQVNRILNGVQPNPFERVIRSLHAAEFEAGDAAIDFLCGELGGHFVRRLDGEAAVVNAVKECAEAIAALSDGEVDGADRREIREAIAALEAVLASHRSPTRD